MATKKPKPPVPSKPRPTATKSKTKISGPSTGGKVISRVMQSDSKNRRVPVTSVTPKITTPKASAKTMVGTRNAVMLASGVGGVTRAATKSAASKISAATAIAGVVALQNRAKEIMAGDTGKGGRTNSKKPFVKALSKAKSKPIPLNLRGKK